MADDVSALVMNWYAELPPERCHEQESRTAGGQDHG